MPNFAADRMGGGTDEFVGREKSAGAEDVTTSVLMRLFFFSLSLSLSQSEYL